MFTARFRLVSHTLIALAAACLASASRAQSGPIVLHVDASSASRYFFRVRETIPARAGRLELAYPKWIPGEHRPSGPIDNMVDLHITANGVELPWRRDPVEMYVFGVDVPAGTASVEVRFTDEERPGGMATENLARVKWNRLLLYPRAVHSDDLIVRADLRLPADWKWATALPADSSATSSKTSPAAVGSTVAFAPVSLTELVDSPVMAGRYFRVIPLPTVGGAKHELDVAGETPEATASVDAVSVEALSNVVREADAIWGVHHYGSYHWLLTFSDEGASTGLEHHSCCEFGYAVDELANPGGRLEFCDDLSHEFMHSWNGKFRRPASLATPDFIEPMHNDLLWVYEGLNQYLSTILPARSHQCSPEAFRNILARAAADMVPGDGRSWRSVGDTATSNVLTRQLPPYQLASLRGIDYYTEGMLIWLEADAIIRTRSHGQKSLDDFCRLFHSIPGPKTGEQLVTYDRGDVVADLNRVLPYDWEGFFAARIDAVTPEPPTRGIVAAGWQLVYNDTRRTTEEESDIARPVSNFTRSIGVFVSADGVIGVLIEGSPADTAGLVLGEQIVAVNNQKFSPDLLLQALIAAEPTGAAAGKPIVLDILRGKNHSTVSILYTGGFRYPHLIRDESRPDLLQAIIAPRSTPLAAGTARSAAP